MALILMFRYPIRCACLNAATDVTDGVRKLLDDMADAMYDAQDQACSPYRSISASA